MSNELTEIEELWAVEAERRWLEIESGEVETIPWEEVRARLFSPREIEPPRSGNRG